MDNSKTLFIYDDFTTSEPILMGKLYVDFSRGQEFFSFEYENSWLLSHQGFAGLDPDIYSFSGRQYPTHSSIFGLFADSSPDRWGRMLINKKERIRANAEGRKPKKLNDSDYLLEVYDMSRMGGIRIKLDENGPFLSNDEETSTPPWETLRALEDASRHFENDEQDLNEHWLNQLLRPGSSLGGARPKATVIDTQGNLWIAKFPSKNDENNIGAWEKVASDLASLCGLNVPESKLETFSKLGSTFLVKRFDRDKDKRIHFASAMTLLGKTDGTSFADGVGYLDIASFIRSSGSHPKEDLIELWKRIVFNMAISNTDDHLRNHAFIYEKTGWRLSPIFDINPVPYGDELSLNVSEDDNRISFELAQECSEKFGIPKQEAKKYIELISNTIKANWEKLAAKYGVERSEIEKMRPAFSECYESHS